VRALLVALAVLLVPATSAAAAQPCRGLRNVARLGSGKQCRAATAWGGRAPVGMTPFAITPLDPGAPPAPTGDSPSPANPAPPPPARLGVVAREWSLTLSRGTLTAGTAIVELQNFGEDAHNLRIERVDGTGTPLDVPEAEAGERKSATGTLAAGDYRVYCALPGHDAAGMHARLAIR
jgi:hypothetical protein